MDARVTYSYDPDTCNYVRTMTGGTATITGGLGNDRITVQGNDADATVDAGDGTDTIVLSMSGDLDLTTGAGADTIVLQYLGGGRHVVTDFTAGPGGDVIDVGNFAFYTMSGDAADLFADGILSLSQRGNDTVVLFDDFGTMRPVLVLANTDATTITASNFSPALTPVITLDVSLVGTAGDDTLTGGEGDDLLEGLGGDDVLTGLAGDDALFGGSGQDSDSLFGGAGNDTLDDETAGGSVFVDGGDGDDNISVYASADFVYVPGEYYGSYISVGGDVAVYGGAGNDTVRLSVFDGAGVVDAGDGDDTITVSGYGDVAITTGSGADTIRLTNAYGGAGLSVTDFTAGAGGDTIDIQKLSWDLGSDPFADGTLVLIQDGADTRIVARAYGDEYTVLRLLDTDATTLTAANFSPALTPVVSLTGTSGDDTLVGGPDADQLFGGAGNDTLTGDAGNDVMDGVAGDDQITDYNGGSATVFGGIGDDLVTVEINGGAAQIDGGDSDDSINVSAFADTTYLYDPDGFGGYDYTGGDAVVAGGAGRDSIDVTVYGGTAQIDAGDGDDVITLRGYGIAGATITGGAGQDMIDIQAFSFGTGSGHVLTDFEAGAGGDVIGFETLLNDLAGLGYTGGNPFGTGHLALEQVGADVVLFAFDGGDPAGGGFALLTFQNTTRADFTDANLIPRCRWTAARSPACR